MSEKREASRSAASSAAPQVISVLLVSGLENVKAGVLNGHVVVAMGETLEETGRRVAAALRAVAKRGRRKGN